MRPTRLTATTTVLALTAALSLAAAPDGCYVAIEGDATTTSDDVIACEQQQWFHRATTHGTNVGYVAPEHGIATFDTTPPAGSVTGGNGGGYATWSTILVGGDDSLVDAQFEGSHTGTLDRLDVDLHILVDSFTRLGNEQTLDIELSVGGATIFSALETAIMPVPEESSQAGSVRLDFAITDLAELLAGFGFDNTADTVHDVKLTVGAFYLDQVTAFAFDTTEVPGGIGFNRVDVPAGTLLLPAS